MGLAGRARFPVVSFTLAVRALSSLSDSVLCFPTVGILCNLLLELGATTLVVALGVAVSASNRSAVRHSVFSIGA